MPATTITLHAVTRVPIAKLREAPWNANLVPKAMMTRIRASLRAFGAVENNVLRPDWTVGARTMEEIVRRRTARMDDVPGWYETLSGNHRLAIYREDGVTEVPSVVVELPDPQAKMLAQALNRTRGKLDADDKLAEILRDITADLPPSDVAKILPHSEHAIVRLLSAAFGTDEEDDVPEAPEIVDSQAGRVYVLGPHRLLCGDSTDSAAVHAFIGSDIPSLMVTDPPYGVGLAQGWRDAAGMERDPAATANVDEIEGDDGFEWEPALGLVPSIAVAYVWHADRFVTETREMLVRAGFAQRQMIVWRKDAMVIGRAHYHHQHELCLYAVRRGATPAWYGGRSQTTVWSAKSPRQLLGSNTAEERLAHPCQKPVAIFEPPVVNHTTPGEFVYDPFAGSGTLLAACAKLGRRALLIEKAPKYCDIVRRRWMRWAQANNVEPGPDALA